MKNLSDISTKRLLTLYKGRFRGMLSEEDGWDEDISEEDIWGIWIQDCGRTYLPEEIKKELDKREHV